MSTSSDVAKCLAFIGCQINPPPSHEHHGARTVPPPAVTISRQTGCGGMDTARALAAFLQERDPAPCGWTVFSKNIVGKMLEEHNLPSQLAKFIPEDRISLIRDMMEEVLGLHPPSETLIHQISETTVHLASVGHVILVGRAASVITRHLKNVFHVRLMAPIEKRAAQVVAKSDLKHEAALEYIKKEDAARKHYLKSYYQHDPDDPLIYDMVINTDRFSPEEVARFIGQAVLIWAGKIAA